ncbi:adhesion G protein-coupled receptor A3-like [Saccostrea echinata]|uniref:adhesion G protein-coupled receptor A3-like n=1 Tax=Saccostrea echinata TaxID=191078 RepID=UPI002A833D69|nr:adhesion G protein-coupled receptor A3-like [Saccostrea echinata]
MLCRSMGPGVERPVQWIRFLLLLLVSALLVEACPPLCTCTTRKPRDGSKGSKLSSMDSEGQTKSGSPQIGTRGRKVVCAGSLSVITSVAMISSLPLDTVILDLSKNAITVLEEGGFNRVSSLQKLDLSHNKITMIKKGAFLGLKELVRLDLSHNKIGSISSAMFEGLINLEKLNFSNNRLNTIPDGTFNNLHALKKIDFQSDFLRCDCHLQWIVKWSRDKNVKIQQSTTCGVPKDLKGVSLRSLKKKDLHCDRPLELPEFEILPNKSQVVFEGDKIPLICRASIINRKTRMVWMRRGEVVSTNRSIGIFVITEKTPDQTTMIHTLMLQHLTEGDSGVWQCMVTTPQGNVSTNINILVISNNAATCHSKTSKTKKGVYKWPRTVAGVISDQPCKRGRGRATHRCSESSQWEKLNVNQCEYLEDLTRKLEAYAHLKNKPMNQSQFTRIADDLMRIISVSENLKDLTHLILSAQIVENLAKNFPEKNQVAVMLKLVSTLMKEGSTKLQKAQLQDRTCSRLIDAIEEIPKHVNVSDYTENIVMETMNQGIEEFQGVTCMAYSQIFSCQHRYINQTIAEENLLGTVHLPSTLYNTSEGSVQNSTNTARLQFILYRNAQLFPSLTLIHDDPQIGTKTVSVVSAILSVNSSPVVVNLSNPITLTFKVKATSENLLAVYWDSEANGGLGDWKTDGCSIKGIVQNYTTVQCQHLSIFAVIETSPGTEAFSLKMFQLMHVAVYVGSCVCLLCLMAVIITYVSCFRFINVPNKMKHSVINISVCVLLLIIGFTMGVKRTDHLLACQIIGISMHYLTLCAIFWITITSFNMMKKFSKASKPPAPPPDMPGMPLPPKPMIRFYLLGWGVPTIICGITAAVSLDHYSEPAYCFLAWDPSLGAFYGPVALLVIFNLVFFLRISCIIQGSTNNLNESNRTEDINDIELTQNGDNNNTEIEALTQTNNNPSNIDPSIGDDSEIKSLVSSVADQEKRPQSQLYAIIAILILFILFWVCGAVAVAEPFKFIIPMQELIFSYLYGITCAIFGIFMLCYFCLSRKDSCSSWKRFFLCEKHPLYDLNYQAANHGALSNGHVMQENGDLDPDVKSYNITHEMPTDSVKQSNINLVPANSSSFIEDSVNNGAHESNIKVFYNPRQNGVAKKFWEKQRHNSRYISRDATKEFNGSITSFSGSEANNRQQTSGNLSDGKSHLSIEIQIQSKGVLNHSQNGKSPLPPQFSNAMVVPHSGVPGHHTPVFSMVPLNKNNITTVAGSGSVNATSPCCSTVSFCESQAVSQHTRSPSSCSLGSRSHPSAFTPVTPRNNTLPKPHKTSDGNIPQLPPSYNDLIKNGSLSRIRDFDGRSQVGDSRCQSPRNQGLHSEPHLIYPPSGPLSSQEGCTYTQYGSVDDHITCEPQRSQRARSHSGGYSSDAGAKNLRKKESFIHDVQQRVPNMEPLMIIQCRSPTNQLNQSQNSNFRSPMHQPNQMKNSNCRSPICQLNQSQNSSYVSPSMNVGKQSKLCTHDSDSGINYKKTQDSDHNSEPSTSRHHRRPHDYRGNSRQARGNARTKFEWDKNISKAKSVPYAYVNHKYAERVRKKMNIQTPMEAKNDWGSPSLEEDSTSSSGNEACFDHNVWVLQNQRKLKRKKETSV